MTATVIKRVSAIVVNFNGGQDLLGCLESLESQIPPLAEIIVVDNASTDQSLPEVLALFPNVRAVANSTNEGFAAGANHGARVATGEVLFFLNPDIRLSPACAQRLGDALDESPGVVGPRVELAADSSDLHGGTIDRFGYPTSLQSDGEPFYVSGSALATSRQLFQDLGGFDSRYFMFMEDIDYCWRVLLTGLEVSVCPDAFASHRGGASTPGGYIRSGQFETTTFRFALRERNTLAMLLKCSPTSRLGWLLPAFVAKIAALVVGALCLRQTRLARDLVTGLVWNFGQLPDTYRRRRAMTRTRSGQQAAIKRIYRGWLALERIRQFGLPRFIDTTDRSVKT